MVMFIRDSKGRFIKGTGGNDYWTGRKRPKSYGEKMRIALSGRKLSEETKKKIGLSNKIALKGRKQSQELINKRINSIKKLYQEGTIVHHFKGKHLSEEHRKKIGISNRGKTMSEITRRKISNTRKEKLRNGEIMHPTLGKHLSEETKMKIGSKNKTTKKLYGESHWNWLGGKSFEPYDSHFNSLFKNAILIRDNNSCVICGSNNKLSVHHIDYNKLNTIKENCVLVCGSCHSKTNFNREHWTKFFQSFLEKNYNYNYLNKLYDINSKEKIYG